ncbi:phage integrase family protein [Burkholderia stagnalis]|uniref:phage integrase family protein n=1 Tax=Burkholderia stagnalis TaxID=1503054 RepID=UPI000F5BD93F|nr:phage integrase family protein [Burkholderia stagnalis]RQQ00437.1 hypothetical protein DF164_29845 [Burkholderia stagnalis]RQY68671.1 hypothetical protein DF110_19160 [Burkholderia stagnalis]
MGADLVKAPQLEHSPEGWFAPQFVVRLMAAGVATFAEPLALIRERRRCCVARY